MADLASNTTVGGSSIVDLLDSTFFVGESINTDNFNGYVQRGTVVVRASNGAICFGRLVAQGTFTVTTSSNTVNEGSTITVTVDTTNISDGIYYWTANRPEDVVTANGSFSISNNQGSFNVTALADQTTESGTEELIVSIRKDSITGEVVGNSGPVTILDTSQDPVEGEALFLTTGTHYFTVPNVTHIGCVAVGGGGGGAGGGSPNTAGQSIQQYGLGGGGGGLNYNWSNPPAGEVLTVFVGAGGNGGFAGLGAGGSGQASYVSSPSLGQIVWAGGGGGGPGGTSYSVGNAGSWGVGNSPSIIQASYHGGGNGGYGGPRGGGGGSGGGGGAGGYQQVSGRSGGQGASYIYNSIYGGGYSGAGGGGTGVGFATTNLVLGGGGTGVEAGLGPSGAKLSDGASQMGNPGSYGNDQNYGGGGAGNGRASQLKPGAPGGQGVVRIIWSDTITRRFPSTATSNSYGTITVV